MSETNMRPRELLALGALGLLAACGGGSGGSNGGPPHTVGGAVSGLAGAGLVLLDNGADALKVSANGAFTFSTPVSGGSPFNVSISTQPSNPTQTCSVAHGSGTISGNDITNVAVTCTTNSYSIGGSVSGLTGSGLVLENNGGSGLHITQAGPYTFPASVPSGDTYSVTVSSQPTDPPQTCTVGSNASGTVGASSVSVSIECTNDTYGVGGGVGGLRGLGLELSYNGGAGFAVTHNGQFSIATGVANGTAYTVAISAQPTNPSQSCTVGNATGIVASANVTSVAVYCPNPVGSFLYQTNAGPPNGQPPQPTAGTVSQYSIDATTGALTPVSAATPAGITPSTITLDPLGGFAYIGNWGSILCCGASISEYTVNPTTGALTLVAGSPLTVAGGGPVGVTIGTTGQFAYITTGQFLASETGVSQFTIDQTSGALTLLKQGEVLQVYEPSPLVIEPTGQYAYAAFNGGTGPASNGIALLRVNATTGVLTDGIDITISAPGATSVTLDPTGRFLYTQTSSASQIAGFAIDATTGGLTPIAGSPFTLAAGANPGAITIAPNGAFLYVTNATTNTISSFALNTATGALTASTNVPLSVTSPGPLVIDPSGSLAYVLTGGDANGFTSAIGYSVNLTTGALSPLATAPSFGTSPLAIAISN